MADPKRGHPCPAFTAQNKNPSYDIALQSWFSDQGVFLPRVFKRKTGCHPGFLEKTPPWTSTALGTSQLTCQPSIQPFSVKTARFRKTVFFDCS